MPLRRTRPEDKSQEWRPKKSVRLYLDDVDEILAVMRQVDDEVRIRTAEHVGTIVNAEELKEAGPSTLDSLELQAGSKTAGMIIQFWDALDEVDSRSEESAIFVRLSRPVVIRITPRDDLKLAGAAQAIHELLSRRQTRTGGLAPGTTAMDRFIAVVALFVLSAVLSRSLFRLAFGAPEGRDALPSFLIPFMLLAALVVGLYFSYRLFFGTNRAPSATIVLAYRADAPTWWDRNRTPVLIGLTTNLVVAAVFFLLGLWLA